jgi:hypothetical protein
MKSLPKGEVMLGGELTDKMQVSFIMRSLLSFIMKFAMSLNPFLHFSFGEDAQSDGRYEYPHLTFPLFRVMDRVVVTAPGEELPELGKELLETEADRVLRRNGKGVNCFKEGYTYSFSFHSMYVDFSRWIICNFPGYRAIDLTGFLGQQKVKVVCYELVDPNTKSSSEDKPPPAYHYNNFKRYLMYMEMTHTSIMSPEELANAEETILDECDPTPELEDADPVVCEGILTEDTNQNRSDVEDSDSGSDDDFDLQRANTIDHLDEPASEDITNSNSNLEKEDDVGSLKPGSEYVLANTVVSLLSTPLPTDCQTTESNDIDHEECFDSLDSHFGITNSGGTAVRTECHDIPIVRFIRAPVAVPVVSTAQPNLIALRNPLSSLRRSIAVASRGMPRSSSSHVTSDDSISLSQTRSLEEIETNNVLTAGDEIMIQCASTGKFLTVHRGWWVNWTAQDLGLKSVFTLEILSSSGSSYALHGTKLVSGVPFRLKSVKWPQWEVGCYDRPVHGRQLVVLFQSLNNPNRSAPSGPIKWGKNGQMVYPLSISVMSDMNSAYSYPMVSENAPDSKNIGRDSEEISPVSFFDFQISTDEVLQALDLKIDIVGSADVFNRKLHQAQLAYIIRISYLSAPETSRVQWTTLRTQEDMDVILNQIPGAQEHSQDNQNGKRRRSYYSSISGPWTNSISSPRFSAPIKLDQLKRATSFATVSARHQCSADQSVYLMSKQIQSLFDREIARATSPPPGNHGTSTPPPKGRSRSTSTNDPLESPRSLTSSENGELSHEFILPPAVLPVLSTSPKATPLLTSMTSMDGKGNEPSQPQAPNEDAKSIMLKALSKPELLDTLFLHDSDPEKYLPAIRREPPRLASTLVARALWDTHWREEIAILYSSYIACYPLLGTKPAWVLSLQEIIGVSYLHEEISPLPRFSVMRIETIGRIHYLAFISKDHAQSFAAKMEGNITNVSFDSPIPSFVELTDPRDRFVVKSGRWRPAGRRLILNARKFTFDLDEEHPPLKNEEDGNTTRESYWMYSARLLKTVFQLDSNNSIRINSESIKRSSKDGAATDLFEAATDQLFPGKYVDLISSCH